MSRHLEKGWLEFEKAALPEGAPAYQRKAMRRAFYAGAMTFLSVTVDELSPGDSMTPADDALMEGLSDEMHAFSKDVTEGRA